MRRFNFKIWEIIVILSAVFLFSFSCFIYLKNISIRKYFSGSDDEEGQVLIGHLSKKSGSLKRQLLGESEFKALDINGPLYNMDILVTGPESGATLQLDESGLVELGPNTMIRLAFQTNLALDGISRVGKVNVVVGQVTGKSGTRQLVISSKEGVTLLKPNTLKSVEAQDVQTRVAQQALKPAPSPSVSATPRLSFTPEEADRIKILSPSQGEKLVADILEPIPGRNVKFTWTMSPPAGKSQLTLWRRSEFSSNEKDPREKVFSQVYSAYLGQGSAYIKVQRPGNYEWEIRGPEGQMISWEKNTNSSFQIDPEVRAIRVRPPLVGGKPLSSNQVVGRVLKKFDITLEWEKYSIAKEYKVTIATSPSEQKPLLEKNLTTERFTFNKDKVLSGDIFYKIVSHLDTGFNVSSGFQKFSFRFDPPNLAVPKENFVISKAALSNEGNRIMLTWQHTNFTQFYEVEIAKDAAFKSIYARKTQKENFFIFPRPLVGKYWWHVRSQAKDFWSPMSPARTIEVRR